MPSLEKIYNSIPKKQAKVIQGCDYSKFHFRLFLWVNHNGFTHAGIGIRSKNQRERQKYMGYFPEEKPSIEGLTWDIMDYLKGSRFNTKEKKFRASSHLEKNLVIPAVESFMKKQETKKKE